jgi:hypothetical protein
MLFTDARRLPDSDDAVTTLRRLRFLTRQR